MRPLSIALLWVLWRVLPFRALGALGEVLGGVLYHVAGYRREIASTNLQLCFPELDDAAREQLVRQHFRALGRASLQETVSWWGSRAEVEGMTRFEGQEHITPHLNQPLPLILFTPHFVGVTIGGVRVTTQFSPVISLDAHIKNPYIHLLAFQARTRFGDLDMSERQGGIRPVLRAIKHGLPLYYPPDLDFGPKDAVFMPLFSTPAATITGLSRIARVTGAVVVPCITRQEKGGYVVRFYPAWEDFPSDDVEADTRRMNAFLEERIREMPAQYFWVHKLFKARPDGELSFYD
jgi:KDO2-lipid IV(A) lauroyltransferase